MTPEEQLEKFAIEYSGNHSESERTRDAVWQGGLKGMEIQKEIDRQEIQRLKERADSYDRLAAKIAILYAEDSEADLGDIGECAASHFGFL